MVFVSFIGHHLPLDHMAFSRHVQQQWNVERDFHAPSNFLQVFPQVVERGYITTCLESGKVAKNFIYILRNRD